MGLPCDFGNETDGTFARSAGTAENVGDVEVFAGELFAGYDEELFENRRIDFLVHIAPCDIAIGGVAVDEIFVFRAPSRENPCVDHGRTVAGEVAFAVCQFVLDKLIVAEVVENFSRIFYA